MKKHLSRFLSCLILGFFGLTNVGVTEAAPCPYCYCGVTVHVADACSFYNVVNNACADTIIELDNDIYLDAPVNLNFWGNIRKNGYKIIERYTVEYPGYYTTEKIISHIPNPPRAVYNVFGVVIGYEEVPDTEVVTYENVWHPGRTEIGYREVF